MERVFSSRWFHLITAVIIAVSVAAAYSNTLHSVFQFDDTPQIVDNVLIRDINNFTRILRSGRGVTMLTFALNYAVGGLNVAGYHIVNIAIHIVNAILAYFLLFNTFKLINGDEAWSKRIAAFSSLIFALHPIQTQAVTYIVQRMESLSALFYLSAILLFIKGAASATPIKKWALYACVCLAYVLGFYAKESAITLPAVILLYDFYFINGGGFKGISARWPVYAVLAGLLVFFTFNTIMPLGGFGDLSKESSFMEVKKDAQSPGLQADLPLGGEKSPWGAKTGPEMHVKKGEEPSAGFNIKGISPKEYMLTQTNVIIYYIALLIVPINQNLDYDFPVSRGLFEIPEVHQGTVLNIPIPPPAISLFILLLIGGAAVYLLARSLKGAGAIGRVISFFIFWFFIILSPTSSFVPILDVIFEHRLYLPSLGIFAIFVILIDSLSVLIFGGKEYALKKAE